MKKPCPVSACSTEHFSVIPGNNNDGLLQQLSAGDLLDNFTDHGIYILQFPAIQFFGLMHTRQERRWRLIWSVRIVEMKEGEEGRSSVSLIQPSNERTFHRGSILLHATPVLKQPVFPHKGIIKSIEPLFHPGPRLQYQCTDEACSLVAARFQDFGKSHRFLSQLRGNIFLHTMLHRVCSGKHRAMRRKGKGTCAMAFVKRNPFFASASSAGVGAPFGLYTCR